MVAGRPQVLHGIGAPGPPRGGAAGQPLGGRGQRSRAARRTPRSAGTKASGSPRARTAIVSMVQGRCREGARAGREPRTSRSRGRDRPRRAERQPQHQRSGRGRRVPVCGSSSQLGRSEGEDIEHGLVERPHAGEARGESDVTHRQRARLDQQPRRLGALSRDRRAPSRSPATATVGAAAHSDLLEGTAQEPDRLGGMFRLDTQAVHDHQVVLDIMVLVEIEGTGQLFEVNDVR